LDSFLERIDELDGTIATIGVHEDTGSAIRPDGPKVVDVAAILELGSPTQTPTAWLRTVIDARRSEIGSSLAVNGARLLRGASLSAAIGPTAEEIVDAMKALIPVVTGITRGAVEARVNGVKVA
jgi:hypothetical protein